jgi:CheY-like chemotaxis protein
VLLDLKMPQTSGFEVLKSIREEARFHNITIVVMSGSKHEADREKAQALGANGYLVKPTRFEDLVKMMEALKDIGHWRKNHHSRSPQKPLLHPTEDLAIAAA